MDYRPIVRERAQALGVDPNLAEALLVQESGGNPNAVSPKGASGLMQLMPGTARELGVDPNVPEQNIDGGLRYLKQQIDKFGVAGGLAAYNAGPGRLQRTGMQFDALPPETRNYVPSVMNRAALIAERSGAPPQPTQQRSTPMDIPTLTSGYQKAAAANDTEAVAEIGGLLQQRFQSALSKAQAANDTEAIAEIQGAMQQFGAPAAPARPVSSAVPRVAPQAATAPTPEKKTAEPRSVLRRVDDFVRGVADTATFGYADEIAGKLDSLFGGGQSGKTNYKDAVSAQRQRDTQGGVERIAGQVTGALAPTVGVIRSVPTASRLARGAAGAGTGAIQGGLYGSGSAEEGKRLEGAATGAAIGAAAGGVLGTILPATRGQKAATFVRGSGDDAAARLDAEIITDIKKIADSQTKRGNPVSAIDLNAVEGKYINDVNQAINALSKVSKDFDAGPLRAAIQNRRAMTPEELAPLRGNAAGNAVADAIEKAQRARSLTQAMQSSGGVLPLMREGVDLLPLPAAINRGVKAMLGGRQTREVATQNVLKQADTAQDVLGRLGPSQATRSAQELNTVVQRADEDFLANIMGAKREQSATKRLGEQAAAKAAAQKEAEKLLKQQEGLMIREGGQIIAERKAAEKAAERAARVPSAGGTGSRAPLPQVSIADLQAKDPTYLLGLGNRLGAPRNATEMSEFSKVIQDQMEARAQRALSNREVQKTVAELAKGPRVDPRIQVLQDSRRPLSGAFQELLSGGRSGLNMNSDQAIDALRLTSRQFKDRPLGQAAQDILRSGNVNDEAAFYGLQNQLRKLQERGVLGGQQQGALSAATSNIRNPVSYAEAVRTAGEAANLARTNAPTKELAQFATKVAGIKAPADKAKAIADRMAKSSDPAEQAFLTQFVEPLTQFGKK